jgi:hypothetical protein
MASKLTEAQRNKLASLSDYWREEADGWKAGCVFLDLADGGLCEMQDRRISGGSISAGPGNTSAYRWFTRRTPAGRKALEPHNG